MRVYIVGLDYSYAHMFLDRGWETTNKIQDADLIQFTGGSDVDPSYYGEELHASTRSSPFRDEQEQRVFNVCRTLGKPMAGICRGGQFLNVMCGGSMYQHVNNHALGGSHSLVRTDTGETLPCTSTHHQMMRAAPEGVLRGVASEATVVEHMEGRRVRYTNQPRGEDVEVLLYPESRVLCFQPHPEYMDRESPCQEYYFELIEELL